MVEICDEQMKVFMTKMYKLDNKFTEMQNYINTIKDPPEGQSNIAFGLYVKGTYTIYEISENIAPFSKESCPNRKRFMSSKRAIID